MSRLNKYQESLKKFIKTKICSSVTIVYSDTMKNIINEHIESSHFILPIILLTIMSSQNKKNKMSLHGYYIASGIELLCIIYKFIDKKAIYTNKYGTDEYYNIIMNLIMHINLLLNENISTIQTSLEKDKDKNKMLKMSNISPKILNEKLMIITNNHSFQFLTENKKHDIIKYHFKNKESATQKLLTAKQINKEDMTKYMNNKYGNISQLALTLGWILSCGDERKLSTLDKIGIYLSDMIKISQDFLDIENDITSLNTTTNNTNYVINFGIQQSFELFMSSKQKFIEIGLSLGILTDTIKDIIKMMEENVDCVINDTTPDLKSNYNY